MNVNCKFSFPKAEELYEEVHGILMKNSNFEKLISVEGLPFVIGGYIEDAEFYFFMYVEEDYKICGKFRNITTFKEVYDSNEAKALKKKWCKAASDRIQRYGIRRSEVYNEGID